MPRRLLTLIALALCTNALAANDFSIEQCLLKELASAGDNITAAQIRQRCQPKANGEQLNHEQLVEVLSETTIEAAAQEPSGIQRRRRYEEAADANPLTIIPHKLNYILLTYNDDPNEAPYIDQYGLSGDGNTLDEIEAKFQISLKIPLFHHVLGTNASIAAAYTQQSWWQFNNGDISAPFRETNYEPELWVEWPELKYQLLGFDGSNLRVSFNHQSNGRGGSISRSWNRIIASTSLEKGNLVLVPRIWYRIPEDDKEYPGDPSGDDNPEMDDYMGYGDLTAIYSHGNQTFSLLFRNNLRTHDNKGAIELDWSFPISNNLRGYIQYFNGYGESLIDYNSTTSRFGIGIQLTDYLP